MGLESEHILEAKERSWIRRGLSMLVDEYEKDEKKWAEDKLGSEHILAVVRSEKNDILTLRSEFAEPGSVEEIKSSQDDLFGGGEEDEDLPVNEEQDARLTQVNDDTPPWDEGAEGQQYGDVDDVAAPEPFEETPAGHLDE